MFLRQSTAVTVLMGPFVDKTDAFSEETTATIVVELSKNAATFVNRNSGNAITHRAEGHFAVHLSTVDTNTLGRLRVKAHDSSTHLPTWRDFMVIPANVYDALIAGTDNLFVDAVEISSSTTAANSVESNIGNLNATISSRSSHTAANVWTHTTRALTDKANFTLTSGERNSIADALLDRSNGIETGWTLRQAIRAILATSAGKMSGAGTGTVIFRNPTDTADRVEADVDGVGNRTNVTYNV